MALLERTDELIATITDTAAGTPEGIRAKAWALELWLNRWVTARLDGTLVEEAEPHELLAMSLAQDLIRRAA